MNIENVKKQVILFDLDGTVIDSKPGIFAALRYTFAQLNMPCPSDDVLCKFIGPSIGSSFMTLFDFSMEEAQAAVATYREYYSTKGIYECSLYDGIEPLITKLKQAGKSVGLATKKPEPFSRTIMEHLGLFNKFDLICGSDVAETHDSKAHIIERCAKALSKTADLSDVVMIGDTKYDIIGSNAACVESIGVLYGYGCREELQQNNATYICADMHDLELALLG